MSSSIKLSAQRCKIPDSWEEIYDFVCQQRWGDGLPIVPPTEERVRRMIEYVGREPNEVIATIPPANGEATVEKIAINAVMAGCRPEYMEVIISAVEAITEPDFNLDGIQHTTNPTGTLAIINGPIRKKLDVNCTWGCLGPGWRANATIGRAVRLIQINSGAVPGEASRALHATPAKYTFCFGEDEEGSLWDTLQAERGFDREASTVTMVASQDVRNCLTLHMGANVELYLRSAANALSAAASNSMAMGEGEPVIVFTAAHVRALMEHGFSKSDVKQYIFEHAKMPLEQYVSIRGKDCLFYARVVDDMVLPCEHDGDIILVVAGGAESGHVLVMPSWGHSRSQTKLIRERA